LANLLLAQENLPNFQKYVYKYIIISDWNFAQIIFPAIFASQGALNNNPKFGLYGVRPHQKVLEIFLIANRSVICEYKKIAKNILGKILYE
jgi:hypothetical protein